MEGLNRMPREERAPDETKLNVEQMFAVLTQEAVNIFSSLPLLPTQEAYEEAIARFNDLGAAQLDRADETRRETLENETLASREMETVLELPPYGRTLRITRAKNGIVTLASA